MRAGIGTAIVVLVLAASSGTAWAQSPYSYQWCLYYMGGRGGGGTSCYFKSYEQCMASASGNGAYCARNPQYRGPDAGGGGGGGYGDDPYRKRHRRHHHYY